MIRKPSRPLPEPASSEEALKFVQELQEKFYKKIRSEIDEGALREHLAKTSADELRRIARRVTMDILKRPAAPQAAESSNDTPPAARPGAGENPGPGTRKPQGPSKEPGVGKVTTRRGQGKASKKK